MLLIHWNNELTISSDYIEKNELFVFEAGDSVVGYYSLVELLEGIEFSGIKIIKGFWLEHMFIDPENKVANITQLLRIATLAISYNWFSSKNYFLTYLL